MVTIKSPDSETLRAPASIPSEAQFVEPFLLTGLSSPVIGIAAKQMKAEQRSVGPMMPESLAAVSNT